MAAPAPCRRLHRLLLREPCIHPGVDLAADPVQERLDHRVPVGRSELVMGFCGGADLFGRQRGTHAHTICRCRAAVIADAKPPDHGRPGGVCGRRATIGSRRLEHAAETLGDAADEFGAEIPEEFVKFVEAAASDEQHQELLARALTIAQDTAMRDTRRALGYEVLTWAGREPEYVITPYGEYLLARLAGPASE